MRKVLFSILVSLTLFGCGSLRFTTVKLVEADQFTLCDMAYNSQEASTQRDARLELEMRGRDWQASTCQYNAMNEKNRREQSNAPVPMMIHDPVWDERAKAYEKNKSGTASINSPQKANDEIEIDSDKIKQWLGL
ncbi:hypothetical protein BIY22_07260 [Vibrio panuliri]|uniref:Lipoprotein n=1 Tax=Vibrio panuliri TaxID=1381081 RepID=A0A1Q9HE31_9VIBR|nr:hypothetical protein [Vibrio panuliri]OLQ87969.1 hypothetical protein BIY22_07260 [Vibrio panuliri]